MLRIAFALLSLLVTTGFIATPAMAQDGAVDSSLVNSSETCNVPRPNDPVAPDDERWVYCDIHMRQFAHREKAIELKNMMNTRASNFRASTAAVKARYEAALRDHHASLGNETSAAASDSGQTAEESMALAPIEDSAAE